MPAWYHGRMDSFLSGPDMPVPAILALSVLGAVLPALLLVLYFYRLDRKRPEPKRLIFKSILFGFIAVLPAIGLEWLLEALIPDTGHRLLDAALTGFLVAGLVEEGVKFAFVNRWFYARGEFDEVADGIVYTACVSLGFALVENVIYSFGSFGTMIARAFTAVPMHAAASGIMGYYIGLSKRGPADQRGKGLLAAILIHGVYDFFAFSGSWLTIMVVPTVIVAAIAVRRLFRAALIADDVAAARAAALMPPASISAVEASPRAESSIRFPDDYT